MGEGSSSLLMGSLNSLFSDVKFLTKMECHGVSSGKAREFIANAAATNRKQKVNHDMTKKSRVEKIFGTGPGSNSQCDGKAKRLDRFSARTSLLA
ncbi:hypothetical protein RvY_12090 [Ramazzottius varieornatus]|uniref:Uncharacterized protein n=1 Tax=Ramazzottius varieornatus TaxID=947166 RepID=A0A1D1VKN7_RAMVA|nr:hypothetical protein RvY_12090 [Ramazzottius varieornatus]